MAATNNALLAKGVECCWMMMLTDALNEARILESEAKLTGLHVMDLNDFLSSFATIFITRIHQNDQFYYNTSIILLHYAVRQSSRT
jgi:hypothetical protein